MNGMKARHSGSSAKSLIAVQQKERASPAFVLTSTLQPTTSMALLRGRARVQLLA